MTYDINLVLTNACPLLFLLVNSPLRLLNTYVCSRCTSVACVPEHEGIFVVSHSDGNLDVYDKVSMMVMELGIF